MLNQFTYRLQNQALVIRLDVSDAKDAFKLFETINNRGLQLSPTDIVKNFLLGNAARFSTDALDRARYTWAQLVLHLDGVNSDSFFRDYLSSILKRRVTNGSVVTTFKQLFMNEVHEARTLPDRHNYVDMVKEAEVEQSEGYGNTSELVVISGTSKLSFEKFLARLTLNARTYGELLLAKTDSSQINRHLKNLRMIKTAAVYSFLMHLRVGQCDEKTFKTVLKMTESLMLRRHVCREPGNDAERLFAGLCSVEPTNPIPGTTKVFIESSPTDEKFRQEFAATNFTSTIIERARYCLEAFEIEKQGKYQELQILGTDSVHVEHIIPQKISTKKARDEFGDWPSYLGEKVDILHQKYVSKIGNLTLFAGPLNIGASNNPFDKKKTAYAESSLLLTQELAGLPEFKFQQVDERSAFFADVAVKLWPRPVSHG